MSTPMSTPTTTPEQPFETRLYIDGQWCHAQEGGQLPVFDPATAQQIALVDAGGLPDVYAAVAAAGRALPAWRRTGTQARATYLRAIAVAVGTQRDALAAVQSLNNGKPLAESAIDIDDVIATFNYYADLITRGGGADDTPVELPSPDHQACIRREAAGVVGLIVPWNFPMVTTAWKLAPALAAGCTVVLKPSEITPLPELALARIVASCGLPPGVFNVVTGTGVAVGAALTTHPGIAKVSFTGSTAVGTQVMQAAATTLKGVGLELGGKSAIVVFDDADIDLATDLILGGAFFNAGQMCSATSRVLIAGAVADALIARLADRVASMVVGNPFDPAVQMGPVSSRIQYEKIGRYVGLGKSDGVSTVIEGTVPDTPGYFIAPTMFVDVPADSVLWREEIFGPVLCIRRFDTEADAIAAANDSDYGLVATIVTGDAARGERVAQALEAGVVWINTPQLIFPQTSWGGVKRSGIGRELGPFGLAAFQEIKQILSLKEH